MVPINTVPPPTQYGKKHEPPPSPVRLADHNWPEGSHPLLSICCTTYNHETYIRDCIDGFLMQETSFPVEILIHDDASTDRTAEIVREYEKRFPRLIKIICQQENQYSQNRRVLGFLLPLVRGKYIALCEGDDFWTDPQKLEIQTRFLEEHPDYVISGHDAYIGDEHGKMVRKSVLAHNQKQDHSQQRLIQGRAQIPNMSRVYRNVSVGDIPEIRMVKNIDKFMLSLLGHYGKSKFHPEIEPACYRTHSGGVWSMQSRLEQNNSLINTLFWIYRYYLRVGNQDCADFYWRQFTRKVLARSSRYDLIKAAFSRLFSKNKIRSHG